MERSRDDWSGGETIHPPRAMLVEKGQAPRDGDVCAKDKPIPARDLVVDPKSKGVAYGFAYIVRPKGSNPEAVQNLISKAPKVELDQKNCAFEPYVLPMHQDQVLVIKSSRSQEPQRPLLAHSTTRDSTRSSGPAPNGGEAQGGAVSDQAGMRHPSLDEGVYHGVRSPLFRDHGRDGSFEIKGVPAGDQNLIVWQETVGFVTPGLVRGMPVKVRAGEVTDVGDVKIDPVKARAALPKAK